MKPLSFKIRSIIFLGACLGLLATLHMLQAMLLAKGPQKIVTIRMNLYGEFYFDLILAVVTIILQIITIASFFMQNRGEKIWKT